MGRPTAQPHADSGTPTPALAPAAARPAPPVPPPRAQVAPAPGPGPPAARHPGFAMRPAAAVLALLLCAGQGERRVGGGGQSPGRPAGSGPACPASRLRAAPAPRGPSPPRRELQHRGQRPLPPDPAKCPGPRTRTRASRGWTPHPARRAPRCPHLIPGLGVRAASAPWLAKVTGGEGRAAAGSRSAPLPLGPAAHLSSCP